MPGTPHEFALSTDLYQLTMGASYHALGMHAPAVFSLHVRELPEQRSFLVVAGVQAALDRLRAMRFDGPAIAYLRSTGYVREDLLDRLADLRFTGDVWAVPEGRVVFANEPILEVSAPILEAQLAETLLMNSIHYPTVVASKAARCVLAAPGKQLLEFGLRREPSIDAGLEVARVAYLCGFAGTSNLLAGERYGIPVAGTVAHSFIEAFPSEIEAFRAFGRTFPGPYTLLIDTYDTVRGAQHAVAVAKELAAEGKRLGAVRLDSGDLKALSRAVRAILDAAGLHDVRIVASGGLDEHDLADLVAAGAPIDIFAVGTRLGMAVDAPTLEMAYKLVEYDGLGRLKLSTAKQSLVGPKQVWRRCGDAGCFAEDVIAGRDEPPPGPGWEPLLEPLMRGGELYYSASLDDMRAHHAEEIAHVPDALRALDSAPDYPVTLSPLLEQRQRAAVAATRRREGI
jgi:nicotinate phosphoribosyltransferase